MQQINGALWLIPLGAFGLFRWVCWLIRRLPAVFYKPYRSDYRAPITVVTPVYQEDPDIFAKAIESWLANHWVSRVLCVVDVTDTVCQEIAASYGDRGVEVVLIDLPGKRPAMIKGYMMADTPLVALVDSDTIWAHDVSEEVCQPFENPNIWGVATRQNVWDTSGLLQKLTDIFLDYRYFDENASQTVMGKAISCISGRTGVYRTEFLKDYAEDFINETFWGVPCNSGDDKRLTSLILENGGRTYLQRSARVWSTFPADVSTFKKQRVRWARNTWRSDFRAYRRGWVLRFPFLAFTMFDKALAGFSCWVSVAFFIAALWAGQWTVLAILTTWWLVSRGAKILPHLRQKPSHIVILPAYVLMTFAMAGIKIWALCTIRTQKWLTREVAVVNGEVVRV